MENKEWLLALQKEKILDQQLEYKQITYKEYYDQLETVFREYMTNHPNDDGARRIVVKALKHKVTSINELKRVLNNELLVMSEKDETHDELIVLFQQIVHLISKQEKMYGELSAWGIKSEHKENFKQFLQLKENSTPFFEQYNRLINKNLLPMDEEYFYRFLTKDYLDFKNVNEEYVDKLEVYLKILAQLDHSLPIDRMLAQVMYYRGMKVEKSFPLTIQKVEKAAEYYNRCMRLDPENETYRSKWLNLLNQAEELLSDKEQTVAIINKRIEINLTLFNNGQNMEPTISILESLLLRKQDILFDIEEQLEEIEYHKKLYQLYSMLLKVSPNNPSYQYSFAREGVDLAEILLSEARDAKGYNNRKAISIIESVLELDSNNLEAILRAGIIQLYNSKEIEAYNTLNRLEEKIDEFNENDLKVEFCLAYAVANAHVNKSEEAQIWLEKAKQFDFDRKYGHHFSSASSQIDKMENIDICNVLRFGKGRKIKSLSEVNNFIAQYEDEREKNDEPKVIFDFRDLDSPKIIGPKRTVAVGSENRVNILECLLEDGIPKSLEQIKNFSSNLKNLANPQIKDLRENIANSFSSNLKKDSEEYQTAYDIVLNEVLLNRNGKYEWAFSGDTYVIKIED